MGIKSNGRGSSPTVSFEMQFKWLLFFSVLAVANSASIFHGEIPVKVIYDEEVTHRLYVRNLDKKTQEEVQKLVSSSEEAKGESGVYTKALRNHEEKVQLSQDELSQSVKHLPVKHEETPKLRIVTPPEVPAVTPEQDLDDNKLFDRIQEIINNGVQRIKDDAKKAQEVVQPEVWNSFNDGVSDFLQSVRNKNSLRQSSNSSSIIDQFQSFASNFFGQLTGQNQNASQDAQQPGFPQNVAGFFQNGISQIQQGLSSAFGGQQQPATVLGDNPSAPPPNPIQGLVQQAQNTFGNIFNPQQQNPADQSSSSPNPIQSFSNSIGQALQGLNPFSNRPGAAGDESSTQRGPFQVIQNALNNLNPFQQTTAKPSDTSSSNPIPTFPSIPTVPTIPNIPGVGQISEAITNPAAAVGSLVGNNPFQSGNPLQGVAQQIGAAIPNNPLQSGNNPIEGVVQQVSAAIPGNPVQAGTNPVESIAQQAASLVPNNPLSN